MSVLNNVEILKLSACATKYAVFQIRIRRIREFFGPLGSRSGFFLSTSKKLRKNLDFCSSLDLL
jgi:hypothetical protein